jgi:ATP-binding cassette, subfamily B, multidrug efflux pump
MSGGNSVTQSRTGDSASLSMPLVPESSGPERTAVGFDADTLWRITVMAFAHRGRMAVALLATVAAGIAQLTIPQLIGSAVDSAHALLSGGPEAAEAARDALEIVALSLLGAAAFRGVATMVQNYQGEAVGQLIGYELRMAFYARLARQSFSYHDTVHTGDLMTRGILDIEGTRLWVDTGILRMVLLAILIIGGGVVLARIDAALTFTALAFVPFVALGASLSRLRLRKLWYALQDELGILTRVMEENLGGIRVVRAFAAQTFELARFDIISDRALAIFHRRIAVFVSSTTTMSFLFFSSMGLVLWRGGEGVIDGTLTVGQLASFLAFMGILQMPVRQIAWMVNSIARASTCGARIFEVLDAKPDIADKPNAAALPDGDGVVRFEGVSFRYPARSGSPLVLRDVSFELRPGKVVGLVGPPGSGKSTLVHLLPRFYDVSAGRITFNGVDIREASLDSLRHAVTVIQQDTYLFTTAIENNVAYADPWADRSAVRQATETAQLHNYIANLPQGYATLVGERGVSLSGGQRQRLAIARGVVPDSKVVVFDDSTAAVDAGTEQALRRALADTAEHQATLIIAHRLSSLLHADEILFLDEGAIVERGTHAELLTRNGRYASLYALQGLEDATGASVEPS